MSNDKPIILIASAGGHLTQAMCATSQCSNLILVSNKVNVDKDQFSEVIKIWDTQSNPFIHLCNLVFAFYLIIRKRPKALISTGGPIAIPFALVAKIMGKKFVFLDTLSRVTELSNTGKLVHKKGWYSKFFCQWEAMAKKHNVEYIGKCFDILSENQVEASEELDTEEISIFVTVGTSQYAFGRLFELLEKMPLYAEPKVKWVIQASDNKPSTLPPNCEIFASKSREDVEQHVKEANLVISHCGIGSINLMLSYRKKVVFVPRLQKYNEFSDDHQLQIATEIENENLAVVYDNKDIPDFSVDDLKSYKKYQQAMDITNYSLANTIRDELNDA